MHAILAFTICLWIGFVCAQSPPHKEHQAESKARATHTEDKRLNPCVIANVLQPPDNQQRDEPNHRPTQSYNNSLATWAIVFFTLALVVVGSLQWWTYRKILNTTKVMERAYVGMSHFPPGLTIEKATGHFYGRMRVKNFGRTPARITDALLKAQVLPNTELLPNIPDYRQIREKGNIPKAFLVTEDEFFLPFTACLDDIPGIEDGTTKLWLYGYVDYIDQFGQRHRAGYARMYDPVRDNRSNYRSDEDFAGRSNLVFVAQNSYSYDRPRQKGEGNDWEEQPASN